MQSGLRVRARPSWQAGEDGELSTSLRHLKVFESIARLGSVRRASEACNLTQPAVSQAIQKLEENLGVALFERRASGTYLNDYGAIFQRRTRRMFSQIEHALTELSVPGDQLSIEQLASRITRSQVRILAGIVEHGTFARAARALRISHTPFQRAARDLERILRVPLFVQTAVGLVATPAAVTFSRALKIAFRELDSAKDDLDATRGVPGGEIVIGAMLMAGSVVLASVLDEFMAAHPTASVRVLSGTAEDMLKFLHQGDVDFVLGLLRDPPEANLAITPLARTPFVVVARRGHPLLAADKVTLAELVDYRWITGTPGSRRRAVFDRLFAGEQRPRALLETCALSIIRLLQAESDHLCLLTSYELLHEGHGLAEVSFDVTEPAPTFGLTTRQDWLPTRLQAGFIELAQKRIAGSLAAAPRSRISIISTSTADAA